MRGGASGSRRVRLSYTLVGSGPGWLELKAPVQHLTEAFRVDGKIALAPRDRVHRLELLTEWYSILIILDPKGRMRGCYCDVRRPPIRTGESTYSCKDLLVDLWVFADGRHRVLDRDELETARSVGWVTGEEYRQALAVVERLAGWARQGCFLSRAWPAAFSLYKGD